MTPNKNGTRWGRGLFAILATSAATGGFTEACGSSFNNCTETRTCIVDEGGVGGEASNSPSARGGDAAGVAGVDGVAGDAASDFDIVKTSPEDSATGVERDVVVELTFSSDVDPASVSAETVKVTGPSGDVEGKLKVAGAVITFTPSKPFALLADYRVSIAPDVAALDGTDLGVGRRSDFQSRDGVFRKPQRLSSDNAIGLDLRGTRSGYAAVTWSDGKSPASPYVIMFDPATASWSKVAPLEADTVKDYGSVGVCLNERGEAFASIGGLGFGAWSRWLGGAWTSASTTGVAERRGCALGDEGTVLTSWDDLVDSTWTAFGATLSPTNQWSSTRKLQTKARAAGVSRFGDGFLVLQSREPSSQVFSQVLDSKGQWSTALPITPSGMGASYSSLSSVGASALYVWGDNKDRIQASLFDGTAWTTTDLAPAYLGKSTSGSVSGYLATWLYQGNAFAARYDVTQGWLDPAKLGPSHAEDYGPGAALDDAGNALAVWPNGSNVSWKRSSHATFEWIEGEALENQDPLWATLATGAASGEVIVVWQNQLGVWASRFE